MSKAHDDLQALIEKAERCQRLARHCMPGEMRDQLLALAKELRAEVAAAGHKATPSHRGAATRARANPAGPAGALGD